MAENLANANVEITVNKKGTTVSGDKDKSQRTLDGIFGAIKKGNASVGKFNKLLLASGILGLGATTLSLLTQATVAAGATTGPGASMGIGSGIPGSGANAFSYEEIMVDGEKQIARVSTATGEILEVLTLQEAIDQGILNEKGKIKDSLVIANEAWDEMVKDFPKQREYVKLTKDEYETLLDKAIAEQLVIDDIQTLLLDKKNLLSQEVDAIRKRVVGLGLTTAAATPISGISSTFSYYTAAAGLASQLEMIFNPGNPGSTAAQQAAYNTVWGGTTTPPGVSQIAWTAIPTGPPP